MMLDLALIVLAVSGWLGTFVFWARWDLTRAERDDAHDNLRIAHDEILARRNELNQLHASRRRNKRSKYLGIIDEARDK